MRTDDMVREALADLAPTAPADTTALAGMHRAIGRRRRRQQVARVAAAVAFVALAVGTTAVVLDAEGDPSQVSTEPDDTTTPTTTPTTPTTTPDTTEGNQVEPTRFGPVAFQLPEGWAIVDQHDQPNPLGGPSGETMCIAPVDDQGAQVGPQFDDCSGLLIHQGEFLPGNEMDAYQPHTVASWSHSTDPPQCPFTPGPPDAEFDAVLTGGEPIEQDDARPVGNRTAVYDRWSAQCELSGRTFEPQAWYVEDSQVLVFDTFSHEETEDFLASFEFDG